MNVDTEVGMTDVVLFVYNGALILSGAWLSNWGTLDVTPRLLAVVVLAALGWTAYFRWQMAPRLARLAGADDEDGSAPHGSRSDQP